MLMDSIQEIEEIDSMMYNDTVINEANDYQDQFNSFRELLSEVQETINFIHNN